MKLYYNTDSKKFETLKTKSRSSSKIEITIESLKANITGEYGYGSKSGEFVSTINGIDFKWIDYSKMLVNGDNFRVFNPADGWCEIHGSALIDEYGAEINE